MTTCEYCGRTLRQGDTIHGLRYGILTSTGFKAAQDSAVTVICGDCGTLVYPIVYSYLDRDKLKYPVILNIYADLKASMENGYKVIQAIAKLPMESQQALQHLIATCKSSR
jgi:hypothetical protein